MEKDLFDSALDDFEETEKTPEPNKPESIQEALNDINQCIGNEEPNLDDLANVLKILTSELENNEEIKKEIESIGQELTQGDLLKGSMQELRDKLQDYLNTHPDLPAPDRDRYNSQLLLYSQVCEKLDQKQDEEALELIAKISLYGDLPEELQPPMPEDCIIT